ncbi:MAG: hypothetical protein ACI4UU_02465 [Clostridia bacterium]
MGKHSLEKKKNKKTLYILLIILLILIIISTIFILIARIIEENNKINTEIETEINTTFIALKNLETEEINKHINYEELIASIDEEILYYRAEQKDSKLEKNLFNAINWNIKDIKINEEKNEVTATVELTNKNFKNLITKWLQEIVEQKANKKKITSQIGLKILEEMLIENETGEKTTIQKIQLKKEDNQWKIILNENLRTLLFPGIESAFEEISN